MGYNLIVKPQAEIDLDEALEWYHDQNENLSLKFISAIEKALEKIQSNPENYQKRYNEIRIIFTKTFPYGIYYTIEENTIFVHAILHHKQNPNSAEQRL